MSLEVLVAASAAALVLPAAVRRLQLSRAKHLSLAGHARLAKRMARWVPGYSYDEARFFAADDAPPEVVARRRAGFEALARSLRERSPLTLAQTAAARERLPDLQFTSRYRVPFQFSEHLRQHLSVGGFWARSEGVELIDLDGQRCLDLSGSYGVNLFGLDFYKDCMAEGHAIGAELGPVLGGYHPCVRDNAERLAALSGLDAVSFHMSGTEAVMQAVRLARYHTRRRRVVRFAGAYHGWWDEVQPGPGNPMPPGEVLTLADMSERSLAALRSRRDVACVLVNPLQALHPNRGAPGDSTLVAGSACAPASRQAYSAWLQRLREVCSRRGIVLILDEVFMGFRLGLGGAQAYYGVQADMVCYGKTLGGGLPVGVVCGRAELMRRYRPEAPADICFARGTFNAHPSVMGAMNAFLRRLDSAPVRAMLTDQDARWDRHAAAFNAALADAGHPLRVAHLNSVWTVCHEQASRYHWMLQFYLRDEGLALSWVGSGRMIFSLNYGEAEMQQVLERLLRACARMAEDGWWWAPPEGHSRRRIGRQLLREMLAARLG